MSHDEGRTDAPKTVPRGTITDEMLVNWFSYHAPSADDAIRYEQVNQAALTFARILVAMCPPSADLTDAIRKIREARMTANAAIACKGK